MISISNFEIVMKIYRYLLLICAFIALYSLSITAYALSFSNKISGIDGPALINAQRRLTEQQHPLISHLTEEEAIDLFEQAPDEIRQALQPYGFFDPHIVSHLDKTQKDHWIAYYRVQPSQPLKFTQIDVRIMGLGAQDPQWKNVNAKLPIGVGEQFSSEQYEEAKGTLMQLALQYGYVAAELACGI